MNKKDLELKAEELFPLPKEEDFVYGESYLIQSALILQRRIDWVAGAMYVIESNLK